MAAPDRHWLFTWTTYGNCLPGDADGFAGNVREDAGTQVTHNVPCTPVDADMPGLERYVKAQMKGPPVTLDLRQAETVVAQYHQTVEIRGWKLEATSVMYNHTHL